MIRHHPPSTSPHPRPRSPGAAAPGAARRSTRQLHSESPSRRTPTMHDALTRVLQLASVRDMDWVTAHFGHR
jgi:hypothetical protein